MLVMSRRAIAGEQLERLKKGYTAFAESEEVKKIIKQEAQKLHLTIICDETDNGCWFIPEKVSRTR